MANTFNVSGLLVNNIRLVKTAVHEPRLANRSGYEENFLRKKLPRHHWLPA